MLQGLEKYITIQEYAKAEGISAWYARKLCRIGKLKAKKVGQMWFVLKDS